MLAGAAITKTEQDAALKNKESDKVPQCPYFIYKITSNLHLVLEVCWFNSETTALFTPSMRLACRCLYVAIQQIESSLIIYIF